MFIPVDELECVLARKEDKMGDIIREIEETGPLGKRILKELDIKEKDKRNLIKHRLEDLVTEILEYEDKDSPVPSPEPK